MLNEKYIEVCEELEWTVKEYDDGTVALGKYSPAGEDFFIEVRANDFAKEVRKYAEDFDQDEHAEMWVIARSQGARGVPSVAELVDDAKAIDEMLRELADALEKAEV